MKNERFFNIIHADNITLLRLLLVGAALAYISFGLFFRTSISGFDPLAPAQRYIAAFILLAVFLSSYYMRYVKNNLAAICVYLGTIAALQTIAFMHIHGYPMGYANSVIVVIVLINLLFNRIKALLVFNCTVFTATMISVLTVDHVAIHRYHYLITLLVVTCASFVVAVIREKQEQAIQENRKKYLELVDNTPDFIYSLDRQGKHTAVNRSVCGALRLSHEEIIGKGYEELGFPQDIVVKWQELLHEVVTTAKKVKTETAIPQPDGKVRYHEVELVPVFDDKGKVSGIRGTNRDITKRKQAEEALKKSEAKYRQLIATLQEGIWIIDHEGYTTFANRPMAKMLGYTPEEMQGKHLSEFDERQEQSKELLKRRLEGIKEQHEARLIRKDGQEIYVLMETGPYQDIDGKITGAIAGVQNITARKKQEEKIWQLSFHDSLTGLYNRAFAEEELRRLDVERQLPLSIIIGDLNGLKLVNDTFGHKQGDALLIKAAETLQKYCRKEDILARWGGDEFLIVLPQTGEEEAEKLCARIQRRSAKIQEDELPVSIALGYATRNMPEQDINEVIKAADRCMYGNKTQVSRKVTSSMLTTMLKMLGMQNHETEEHSWRLQKLAIAVGEKLGLPTSELNMLSILVLLHDIGKIGISEEILMKPEELTDEQWEVIKKHSEKGYRITFATDEFHHLSQAVLYHHEHWDGSGYPKGLKGEDIPILSRIVAVVDAYDAMTNFRPYNPNPKSKKEAIAELKRSAGSQLDPELVKIFAELLEEDKIQV